MAGYRKLGRPTDQRIAMLRNLVTSFLKYGKIETTETRAKETRNLAEKMITLGKEEIFMLEDKSFVCNRRRSS